MTNKYEELKIVIFGAGAVGCFVGGAWIDAGLDVTLVGRERIAKEVADNGLTLSDNMGYSSFIPASNVNYTTDLTALHNADLICLAVKNTGTEQAAKDIKNHARPDTPILSLQNGVSNVERLSELLPDRDIYAGMVPYNVAWLGPGKWYKGSPGDVIVQDAPITDVIKQKLGRHPIKIKLEKDMEPIVWGKLLLNLNNAVNALSGRSLLDQLKQPGYRKIVSASMREALTALKAKGIRPAKVRVLSPSILPTVFTLPNFIYLQLLRGKIDPKATSSMADDFIAGRLTEIDYLNGEVVKLAEEQGTAAPANKKIISLIKAAEKGGRRDWSPEELVAKVLG